MPICEIKSGLKDQVVVVPVFFSEYFTDQVSLSLLASVPFVYSIMISWFLLLFVIVHAKRDYSLNRRIEESVYKGNVFSRSNRIHSFKFYPINLVPSTPSNGSTNSTLEDAFEDLLFDHIGEKLKIKLRSGISSIGMPPLEPFKMEAIKLEPLIGGDPFKIILRNLRVRGLSLFVIRELSSKLSELRFKIGLMFPKLEIDCNYIVNGTLYEVFDVTGSGYTHLEYNDVYMRTIVNLDWNNETLSVASADAPFVDFGKAEIMLKNSDGIVTTGGSSLASELGPVLFWMLADEVVSSLNKYAYRYVNDAIKEFKLPPNFKPVITWLVKRNSPSLNTILLRRFFPISILSSVVNAFSGMKHQINIPFIIENLRHIRSSFKSSIRRFL